MVSTVELRLTCQLFVWDGNAGYWARQFNMAEGFSHQVPAWREGGNANTVHTGAERRMEAVVIYVNTRAWGRRRRELSEGLERGV